MQGVVKAYNPATGDGIIVRDTDLSEYELAPHALEVRSSACCAKDNESISPSTLLAERHNCASDPKGTWAHRVTDSREVKTAW